MTSIRVKVLVYFMALIVIIAIIFAVGINSFSGRYYYGKKIDGMTLIVDEISNIYATCESEDEAFAKIEYLSYLFEGVISISYGDDQIFVFENQRPIFLRDTAIEEYTYHGNIARVYESTFADGSVRWLVYSEEFSEGMTAYIQIPVVSIDETISVLQAFTYILLLIATLVSILLAIILSRSLSRPIQQIHNVAIAIGDMNFDVEFKGKQKDELGDLGRKLNDISLKLQLTIDDLQTELQKEKNIDIMRRRFVAQVSHELQTPISIISSYVEALNDGILEDDEILYYYKVIEDESNKMSKIIKDLLELSQLQSGNMTFNMKSFDLNGLVQDIVDRYEPVIEKDGLELISQLLIEGKANIEGDSLRIEQGITNVLNNAIKHSNRYVRVVLTEIDKFYMLSVENSGERILVGDLEHIFESFYKGKSRVKIGTGLGLAITSEIFDYHNIEYSIQNSDSGVVFNMRFEKG